MRLFGILLSGFRTLTTSQRTAETAAAASGDGCDSGREHYSASCQPWATFLREIRYQKNTGAHVNLAGKFELGIVGESFNLTELKWVQHHFADSPSAERVTFTAYLIPEPENPHSPKRDAVRVESPRGRTIGHLSSAHAAEYADVFKALHSANRVGACSAVAVGGTKHKPNIGVWIRIAHAAWMAEQLTRAQEPRKPRRQRTPAQTPPADQPF